MSDYLDPSEWLHLAQQLDRGDKASHRHTCGEGQKLLVENKEAGYAAWCYRCSMLGFVPHPKPSLAERIAALRAAKKADEEEQADPRPPMPANFDVSTWPSYAQVWLYKAGLSKPMIAERGIYWCERIKRVVIPILNGSTLCYWQARGFEPERPKYLNPKVDKPIYKMGDRGGLVVITEDILSAVKVGQVCDAWSILGTSMPEGLPMALNARSVAIWLDPDKAGRNGAGKLYRGLSAAGIPVRVIRSDMDPKCYSRSQIEEFLAC